MSTSSSKLTRLSQTKTDNLKKKHVIYIYTIIMGKIGIAKTPMPMTRLLLLPIYIVSPSD